MLFKLTDEQLMIQSMVREFSRKVVAPTAGLPPLPNGIKPKSFPVRTLNRWESWGSWE